MPTISNNQISEQQMRSFAAGNFLNSIHSRVVYTTIKIAGHFLRKDLEGGLTNPIRHRHIMPHEYNIRERFGYRTASGVCIITFRTFKIIWVTCRRALFYWQIDYLLQDNWKTNVLDNVLDINSALQRYYTNIVKLTTVVTNGTTNHWAFDWVCDLCVDTVWKCLLQGFESFIICIIHGTFDHMIPKVNANLILQGRSSSVPWGELYSYNRHACL